MTTILLLLIFPIGVVFYINERKNRAKYQAVFDEYMQRVDADTTFAPSQKIDQIEKLFNANRYDVIYKDAEKIVGERKVLSMGLLMMGLFFYVFYFFFFQKPHKLVYKVSK